MAPRTLIEGTVTWDGSQPVLNNTWVQKDARLIISSAYSDSPGNVTSRRVIALGGGAVRDWAGEQREGDRKKDRRIHLRQFSLLGSF